LNYFSVELLAPVGHREECPHLGAVAVEARHELGELVEGAQRERGRDDRHEQDVGGVHDVL
jgi:hypothetical protein